MEKRKYLVVIDPSHDRHLALERMIQIIQQQKKWDIEFHLIIGFEIGDKTDTETPMEVIRSIAWFTELLRPVEEANATYTSEFFWTRDWRKSITDAAARYNCDTIMLSEASAEHKRGFTDSKWDLVRHANCDVVITDVGTTAPIKCILAAVNTQAKDPTHVATAEKILERGLFLSEYFEADLHVVNAYKDSEDFPDRALIGRMSGLPREHIHRDMGKPEEVIARVAEKVKADMVILGISPRRGLAATFSSHTSEKVMERITIDVVALS
ncbi:universal stress protein [Pseudomonadota bacterium]